MQTYAAQVEIMDQGIGSLIQALENRGMRENTLIIFLSDNGASGEDLPQYEMSQYVSDVEHIVPHGKDGSPMRVGNTPDIEPGPSDTFASYGPAWANLSNTPFRRYKKWTHQGGIAAPFIASWPGGGFRKGEFVRAPHQLVDVVPTILDATGVGIPKDLANHEFRGYSMLDEFRGEREDRDRYLYWEHVGNSAIRRGKFKLVRERHSNWELYNLEEDPTELNNVADDHVDMVREFIAEYERWANAVGVLPWERTERIYREQGLDVIIGGA